MFLSCLIVIMLLLGIREAIASTTIDTQAKLLYQNSGQTAYSSSSDKTVDSFTMPTLSQGDKVELDYMWSTSSTTSVAEARLTIGGTDFITGLYPSTLSTSTSFGTCDIYKDKDATAWGIRCDSWARNGNIETQVGTITSLNLSGGTIALMTNITTASARTIGWSWTITLLKGSSATTSISEEDGLCHATAGTGISITGCAISSTVTGEDGLSHLPSQTGNSGKYLTTNGTVESWGSPASGCTTFSCLTGIPTTLSGYGITDPIVLTSGSYSNPSWITGLAWSKVSSTPTTLSGYGITDNVVLSSRNLTINGVVYDLSADRSWTVTGGGGGCTDFACLTGTDGIIIYDEPSMYSFGLLFLLITFALTFWLTYKIIKKVL